MSEHHADLRVGFYPRQGQWTCVVQRVDSDGMPLGEDLVSATAATKEDARDRAWTSADDPQVKDALKPHATG
jgi:hypothetical protein